MVGGLRLARIVIAADAGGARRRRLPAATPCLHLGRCYRYLWRCYRYLRRFRATRAPGPCRR